MGNTMKQLITPKKCTERNCTNKIIKKWARCKSLALGKSKKQRAKVKSEKDKQWRGHREQWSIHKPIEAGLVESDDQLHLQVKSDLKKKQV